MRIGVLDRNSKYHARKQRGLSPLDEGLEKESVLGHPDAQQPQNDTESKAPCPAIPSLVGSGALAPRAPCANTGADLM